MYVFIFLRHLCRACSLGSIFLKNALCSCWNTIPEKRVEDLKVQRICFRFNSSFFSSTTTSFLYVNDPLQRVGVTIEVLVMCTRMVAHYDQCYGVMNGDHVYPHTESIVPYHATSVIDQAQAFTGEPLLREPFDSHHGVERTLCPVTFSAR